MVSLFPTGYAFSNSLLGAIYLAAFFFTSHILSPKLFIFDNGQIKRLTFKQAFLFLSNLLF